MRQELDWYKAKVRAAEYALAWEFIEAPKAVEEYQRDVKELIEEVERLRSLVAGVPSMQAFGRSR